MKSQGDVALLQLVMSHPSRVRGLKCYALSYEMGWVPVAPLAGAWIEMPKMHRQQTPRQVAPLAGAWIEMVMLRPARFAPCSRTPRGCVD